MFDLKYFPPLPVVYMLPKRSAGVFKIIFLGSLVPPKGLLHLLNGMNGLKAINIKLQIFGWRNGVEYAGSRKKEAAYRELCKSTIGWLHDRNPSLTIELKEFCRDQMEVLRGADLVVVPSVKEEGFGRIVVEGWAAQSLVLAGDVPNLNNLIVNRLNGFCVDFNDPDLVSSMLREILQLTRAESKLIKSSAIARLNKMWATRGIDFE